MPPECPAPLVGEEVDLTDFKFMPLEVSRLLQSEWWIVACAEDPRRAAAALNLWARSWHQRPAASLPNNEVVLATMALVPLTVWRDIGDAVMEPWVLCSDGRWYHPVVAEKAMESWEQKRKRRDFSDSQKVRASARWGSDAAREVKQTRSERLAEARRKGSHTKEQWAALLGYCGGKCVRCGSRERIVKDHITPIYKGGSDSIENIQPFCTPCNSAKGPDTTDFRPDGWRDAFGLPAGTPTGTPAETPAIREREREKDREFHSANALPPSAAADGGSDRVPKGEGYTPEFEAWWKLYPRKDEKGAAFRAFKIAAKMVPLDRLMDGVRAYAAQKKADPTFIKHGATWLNGHCWNDEPLPMSSRVKRFPGYVPMAANGG